ncbi:hypothetical protein Cfor_02249, partial [Coptotermes formosanus]
MDIEPEPDPPPEKHPLLTLLDADKYISTDSNTLDLDSSSDGMKKIRRKLTQSFKPMKEKPIRVDKWALANNKISRTSLPLSTKASEVENDFNSDKILNTGSDGYFSTRQLYKDTDPGPYVVSVELVSEDPKAGTTLHPLKFGYFLQKNNMKNILEDGIKKIGRNRVMVTFKSALAANLFLNNSILVSNNYKTFIPTYNICKLGIVREIPIEWSHNDIATDKCCSEFVRQKNIKHYMSNHSVSYQEAEKKFLSTKKSFVEVLTSTPNKEKPLMNTPLDNSKRNTLSYKKTILLKPKTHAPLSKGSNIMSPPWWDKECTQAIHRRNISEKNCNLVLDLNSFLQYKNTLAATKRLLKKKKRDGWLRFCLSLSPETSPSVVWRNIRRFRSSTKSVSNPDSKLWNFMEKNAPNAEVFFTDASKSVESIMESYSDFYGNVSGFKNNKCRGVGAAFYRISSGYFKLFKYSSRISNFSGECLAILKCISYIVEEKIARA